MNIQTLIDEWKKDSRIDKDNLGEENLKTATLHAKWLEIHSGIRSGIRSKERALKRLEHLKHLWYTNKLSKEEIEDLGWSFDPFGNYSKPLKSEFGRYIEQEDDISELKNDLLKLKECELATKEILGQVNWRNKGIEGAFNWLKFQSGL